MKRKERDLYETAREVTELLCDNESITGTVYEPCAGNMQIAGVLNTRGCKVIASDITWGEEYDATQPICWRGVHANWVVMNPPFKYASAILTQALETDIPKVAVLLRLSFLEPVASRQKLWEEYGDCLKRIIVLNPRPQFREDTKKTDSVTVAWFLFDKNWSWKQQQINNPFFFASNWRKKRGSHVACDPLSCHLSPGNEPRGNSL